MPNNPRPPLPRQAVRNAADPEQVRRAARQDEQREQRFLVSLQAMLAQEEGRIVIWELLTRAGIFRSVWDQSAKIHYNAGRQDYGHELLALCLQADESLYITMETEARSRSAQEARGNAAATMRQGESQ